MKNFLLAIFLIGFGFLNCLIATQEVNFSDTWQSSQAQRQYQSPVIQKAFEILDGLNDPFQEPTRGKLCSHIPLIMQEKINSFESAAAFLLMGFTYRHDMNDLNKLKCKEAFTFFKTLENAPKLINICKEYKNLKDSGSFSPHTALNILQEASHQEGIDFDLKEIYLKAAYNLFIILEPKKKTLSFGNIPAELWYLYQDKKDHLINYYFLLKKDGFSHEVTFSILNDLILNFNPNMPELLADWWKITTTNYPFYIYKRDVLTVATKLYEEAVTSLNRDTFENRFSYLEDLVQRNHSCEALVIMFSLEPNDFLYEKLREISQREDQRIVLKYLKWWGQKNVASSLKNYYKKINPVTFQDIVLSTYKALKHEPMVSSDEITHFLEDNFNLFPKEYHYLYHECYGDIGIKIGDRALTWDHYCLALEKLDENKEDKKYHYTHRDLHQKIFKQALSQLSLGDIDFNPYLVKYMSCLSVTQNDGTSFYTDFLYSILRELGVLLEKKGIKDPQTLLKKLAKVLSQNEYLWQLIIIGADEWICQDDIQESLLRNYYQGENKASLLTTLGNRALSKGYLEKAKFFFQEASELNDPIAKLELEELKKYFSQ